MTNSDIIAKVRATKGRQKLIQIAHATGVPPKTLEKIFYGDTDNPRGDTLDALRGFYERKGRPQ